MNSHKWVYVDGVVFHCSACDQDSDFILANEWMYGLDCDGGAPIKDPSQRDFPSMDIAWE